MHLNIDGMLAVHAARALHTALGGIEGITTARVSLGEAELQYQGTADNDALRDALRYTLETVGLRMSDIHIEADRQLPQA